MAAFDYTDYSPAKDEQWVNYDSAHSDVRNKCKTITPYCGLVYNDKSQYYIITLSRNLENLERDWKTAIESLGLHYMGEAFCGSLCVYFKAIVH